MAGARGPFFDDLEVRDPEERERAQFAALPDHIAHAKATAPYFSTSLKEVDPQGVASRAALAGLAIVRKADLIERQTADPPFGGLASVSANRFARLFQSPGPIYEAQGLGADYWRFARAFYAAGARAGDIIHNSFSYHLTPAGFMMESAAHELGCAVIAAGVGQTELQVRVIGDLRPTVFAGTPSFLKILLEKGRELGVDVSSLGKAGVGGEALPPSLRAELQAFGVAVLQSYGTAELGLIAYESEAMEGMIVDEGVIVEIVEPGSGTPVAEGETGEVVVTTFCREYPLVRFATGDLSAVWPGASPCGRTNMRLRGWMGRADQSVKVKGLFVHPNQVHQLAGRHPEILKLRLVVDRQGGTDVMTLHCEVAASEQGLGARIAESIQAVCKVKGRVAFAPPHSLADDGKLIDDIRNLS